MSTTTGRRLKPKPVRRPLRTVGRILLLLMMLVIAGYVVLGLYAGRKLTAKLAELKRRGVPITMADIAPPPVPASENAALLYVGAVTEMTQEEEDALPAITRAPDIAVLRPLVARHQEALNMLRQAAELQHCRFDVNWEAGWQALFPHLSKLRSSARVLAASAVVNARDGYVEGACEDIRAGLRISQHLQHEPTLISLLVRLATDGIALEALQYTLTVTQVPPAKCRELYDLLAETEYTKHFGRGLDTERAGFLWAYDKLQRNPRAFVDGLSLGHNPWTKAYAYGRLRPLWDLDAAYALGLYEREQALANRPWRDTRAESATLDAQIGHTWQWFCLTRTVMPSYALVRKKVDLALARVEVARIALALEAYRHSRNGYPDSLAQLEKALGWGPLPEDVFTGKPCHYEHRNGGYLLYSIGEDLTDDKGKPYDPKWKTGDIVWRAEARLTADSHG